MSWQSQVEAATLVTATNHREIWDADDLEFVAAFQDTSSDEELALALGRSYYAITAIKRTLEERMSKEVAARARASRERSYTFIDGDVPPGWW